MKKLTLTLLALLALTLTGCEEPTKDQQAQQYAEKKVQTLDKAVLRPFTDIKQAYTDGYTACEQSQWRSVEDELPGDGDYLTLIRYDSRLIMEIAPWRGGLYQGGYTLLAYTGQASVTHWMPIPSLPGTNTEKK